MPIFKTKNENFFKEWNSEMAYVLGYFLADGCITINPRGSHYLEFACIDVDLLEDIRRVLGSNHKIKKRIRPYGTSYRLQIGSKKMCQDLFQFGITQRKTGKEKMPPVPKEYFPDFVRGYFDGDGGVLYGEYKRKNSSSLQRLLLTHFTCSNREFLQAFHMHLKNEVCVKGGFITRGKGAWHLTFSKLDSVKLFSFMHCREFYLQLNRKYVYFIDALFKLDQYQRIKAGYQEA